MKLDGVLWFHKKFLHQIHPFVRLVIFDLQLGWTVGVGGEIFIPLPTPLFLFLTVDRPLSLNFSSPQPSAAIKIKDGYHNIRYEIT